jgi:signal transduction histidine kinase
MQWMSYHVVEESAVALICVWIAARAYAVSRSLDSTDNLERRSRTFLLGAGFLILGLSSLLHASIHAFGFNLNVLYQTLMGYCLGLFTIITAISAERPWRKRLVPLLYLPLLALLFPGIYEMFPIFSEFRPLVWVVIAYLSGIVSILYLAAYYNTRLDRFLLSAFGHLLICSAAIALFFPTGIGSNAWVFGHILRPLGFAVLFVSVNRQELLNLKESVVYKFLTTFSLMAAIPVLAFGMVVFYETIQPIETVGKKLIIFHLVLLTMASALFFALVLILKLMRPLLTLKSSVDRIAIDDLDGKVEAAGSDEIGELSTAFNDMLVKLRSSLSERERLTRLAATGELSATLAHEIKNPLNAIGSAALYLKKNVKGDLIAEFSRVIYDEVMRINKLTSNLLNFAKPLQAEFESADVNDLVRETVNLLREECEERGLSIETDLLDGLPSTLVDRGQMKQVLINLALNSLDAVPPDGRIRIVTGSANGSIRISVEDNGKGISEEDFERIFNPFFTTKTRGTGLGLAVTKKVVKEHGGDILADSSPGGGSVFTITLPVRS